MDITGPKNMRQRRGVGEGEGGRMGEWGKGGDVPTNPPTRPIYVAQCAFPIRFGVMFPYRNAPPNFYANGAAFVRYYKMSGLSKSVAVEG